jgi:hypothetical protein
MNIVDTFRAASVDGILLITAARPGSRLLQELHVLPLDRPVLASHLHQLLLAYSFHLCSKPRRPVGPIVTRAASASLSTSPNHSPCHSRANSIGGRAATGSITNNNNGPKTPPRTPPFSSSSALSPPSSPLGSKVNAKHPPASPTRRGSGSAVGAAGTSNANNGAFDIFGGRRQAGPSARSRPPKNDNIADNVAAFKAHAMQQYGNGATPVPSTLYASAPVTSSSSSTSSSPAVSPTGGHVVISPLFPSSPMPRQASINPSANGAALSAPPPSSNLVVPTSSPSLVPTSVGTAGAPVSPLALSTPVAFQRVPSPPLAPTSAASTPPPLVGSSSTIIMGLSNTGETPKVNRQVSSPIKMPSTSASTAVMSRQMPSFAVANAHWVPDSQRTQCLCCGRKFVKFYRTRHHCRACGEVVCDTCSRHRLPLHISTQRGSLLLNNGSATPAPARRAPSSAATTTTSAHAQPIIRTTSTPQIDNPNDAPSPPLIVPVPTSAPPSSRGSGNGVGMSAPVRVCDACVRSFQTSTVVSAQSITTPSTLASSPGAARLSISGRGRHSVSSSTDASIDRSPLPIGAIPSSHQRTMSRRAHSTSPPRHRTQSIVVSLPSTVAVTTPATVAVASTNNASSSSSSSTFVSQMSADWMLVLPEAATTLSGLAGATLLRQASAPLPSDA